MGKVRFYNPERDEYVSLRVESDGIYLDGHKLRPRKVRESMPPQRARLSNVSEGTAAYYARIQDPDVLEKIIAVLCDLEETMRLDPKAMVTFKPAYKKPGYQSGISYAGVWTNLDGGSLLETILQYFHETLAEK